MMENQREFRQEVLKVSLTLPVGVMDPALSARDSAEDFQAMLEALFDSTLLGILVEVVVEPLSLTTILREVPVSDAVPLGDSQSADAF